MAPAEIAWPLVAAVYRAPLGACTFNLFLAGLTGVFKTALAALAQQHWGPGLDAEHLPGSWQSTANALEAVQSKAKDALAVFDDFAPGGTAMQIDRANRDADRVFRSQANQSGRQRLRQDASFRAAKVPRGLTIGTGEDLPRGQSLRARLLALELTPGAVDLDALTRAQQQASDGLYAQALAGYLAWLAPRFGDMQANLRRERDELRARASGEHRQTPGIVAALALGVRYLLAHARELEAVDEREAEQLWDEAWQTLNRAADAQAQHQRASDPTRRFLELLSAALASGRAHVAGPDGDYPVEPRAWGWQRREDSVWRPGGERVGWREGDALYLDWDAAFAAVQRMATTQGESIPLSAATLRKRLDEQRLLASRDEKRETLSVRKHLSGKRRQVVHLHVLTLERHGGQGGRAETDDDDDAGEPGRAGRDGRVDDTDRAPDGHARTADRRAAGDNPTEQRRAPSDPDGLPAGTDRRHDDLAGNHPEGCSSEPDQPDQPDQPPQPGAPTTTRRWTAEL